MSKLSLSVKFYMYPRALRMGMYPIYCRITVNRKKTEFSTNELVKESKWNAEKQSVKGDAELTGYLIRMNAEIRSVHKQILESGEVPTAKMIKDKFLRKDEMSQGLMDYVNLYVDNVELLPEYSHSTWKKYKTVRGHLKKFLGKKKKASISLIGFNLALINEFQHYLKTEAQLSVNTTTKYLKVLKTVYNRAIQFGHIKDNPFANLKFKHERTNREFLTDEELKRLENLKLSNESLERVRDIFIFSCYSGLRFTDVGRLTERNITKDQHGEEWIEITQIKKTGDQHRIPLLAKSKAVIEKYKDAPKKGNQLLPVRSNQKVNTYLKILAGIAEIDKHLTFHMARHTFATTVALSNDVPIKVVSEWLGHKDVRTTEIYAKITGQYMQKYADKLNKIL